MKKVLVVSVVLVLALCGYFFFSSSDEQLLQKNMDLMAGFCSTTEQESVVVFARKVTAAAELCTDPCRVVIKSLAMDRLFSFQELRDHIMMMKRRLAGTQFHFDDSSITLKDSTSAEIITTLRLSGNNADGRFTDAYEVKVGARKVAGKWLFSSFAVIEFMER